MKSPADTYLQTGQLKLAISAYQKALKTDSSPQLHHNLGIALAQSDKPDLAVRHFKRAISLDPNFYHAHLNLGLAYRQLGNFQLAKTHLLQAIKLQPQDVSPYLALAKLYQHTRRLQDSLQLLDRAESRFTNPEIHNLKGISLFESNRPGQAAVQFSRAYNLKPQSTYLAQMVQSAYSACSWRLLPHYEPLLDSQTKIELNANQPISQDPFTLLMRTKNRRPNYLVAKAYSRRFGIFSNSLPQSQPQKIRLGYISSDFRDHVIGHLTHKLFQHHDRSRFHLTIISNHPGDSSRYYHQIKQSADTFVDLSQPFTFSQLRRLHLDILIDFNGHSRGNALPLLSRRLAPVQICYLGWPGTTGTAFHDYVLGDRIITPIAHQPDYSEKILQLNRCYQISSYTSLQSIKSSRQDHQLASKGIVFCSFNLSYKITRKMFDVWLKILEAVPHSVLWLIDSNHDAKTNLQHYAASQGIRENRLIFAPRVPLQDHLERLQHAHIALDTHPFNGGATTSNALYAGVPVITLKGTHYPSRMSTSLLSHLGLPQLITPSLKQYRRLAIDLASQPKKLNSLKSNLQHLSSTSSMFDPKDFTRQLESTLLEISA